MHSVINYSPLCSFLRGTQKEMLSRAFMLPLWIKQILVLYTDRCIRWLCLSGSVDIRCGFWVSSCRSVSASGVWPLSGYSGWSSSHPRQHHNQRWALQHLKRNIKLQFNFWNLNWNFYYWLFSRKKDGKLIGSWICIVFFFLYANVQ